MLRCSYHAVYFLFVRSRLDRTVAVVPARGSVRVEHPGPPGFCRRYSEGPTHPLKSTSPFSHDWRGEERIERGGGGQRREKRGCSWEKRGEEWRGTESREGGGWEKGGEEMKGEERGGGGGWEKIGSCSLVPSPIPGALFIVQSMLVGGAKEGGRFPAHTKTLARESAPALAM